MLRLFVAVDPPESERRRLGELREPIAGARWIEAPHIHLTVRFLGFVADADVAKIGAALATVAAPAFSVALAGVGTFPPPSSRKPPHVLWAGVAPAAPLVTLKAAIDTALGPDPEDRPYAPHLTLARLKSPSRAELAAFLARHRALAGPAFPIGAFHLYESRAGEYTILRSFTLGA